MLTTKNGYKRDIYCCIFYCIHSIGLYVLSIGNEACHITVWMIVKTVLTVTFSSYGNRQISTPHKIDTPELINKKSRHSWLRPREDPYTKFGTNPPNEGFCANGWNITKNYFYLYLFFSGLHTGQTRGWIFTRDSSNDVKSRKDVPFRGPNDVPLNFGVKTQQKLKFWGRE